MLAIVFDKEDDSTPFFIAVISTIERKVWKTGPHLGLVSFIRGVQADAANTNTAQAEAQPSITPKWQAPRIWNTLSEAKLGSHSFSAEPNFTTQ